MAILTFIFNDLTCSATIRTCLYITDCSEERLLCKYDLTFTATFRTGCFARARFCTCSVAGRTWILQIQLQFFIYTENSFFKCDPDACSDICTLHRSIAGTSSAAAKHIAENITKDITEICTVKIKSAVAAAFKCRMTKLIILLFFLRIT